jgi:hypothetical protein
MCREVLEYTKASLEKSEKRIDRNDENERKIKVEANDLQPRIDLQINESGQRRYFSWCRATEEEKRKELEEVREREKLRLRIQSKKYQKTLPGRLSKYKASAKTREIEWGLSSDEACEKFKGPCAYCGRIPEENNWNGIDRIDSAKGYIPENCVSCCKKCNLAKGTLDKNNFINMCTEITQHAQAKSNLEHKSIQ